MPVIEFTKAPGVGAVFEHAGEQWKLTRSLGGAHWQAEKLGDAGATIAVEVDHIWTRPLDQGGGLAPGQRRPEARQS